MPTVEERLAYLEGRAGEQTHAMNEFRDVVRQLHSRMDRLEHRMDGLSGRIDTLDAKVDARFDGLDDKISRTFLWVVGLQTTVLVAVIGTLVASVAR